MPVTYRARNDVYVTDGKERPDHPHEEYGSTDASSKLLDGGGTHLKKDTKPTARLITVPKTMSKKTNAGFKDAVATLEEISGKK